MKKFIIYIRGKSYNDGRTKSNNRVKNLITLKNVNTFLDTGCFDGKFTMEVAKSIKANKVYGVEFIDELREIAEERGIICEKLDLNKPWPYESDFFDVILSSQVIEHLHNTRLYCEESYRCLRRGGQLIINTENLSSLINLGALMLGWMPFSAAQFDNWVGVGNPLKFDNVSSNPIYDRLKAKYYATNVTGTVGHVRVLSIKGLQDCMERTGFRHVSTFTTGFLPFWGRLSDFLCKIDKRHGHFLIATGFK